MYRQSEKMLNSNTSSTCPDNMANFGLLAADIDPVVWGTPANFNGFRVLAALLHGSQVKRQPHFAALNRRRHLCSTGRPSGWALAHILVLLHNLGGRRLDVYHTSTHDVALVRSKNAGLKCAARVLAALVHGSQVMRQPNFAALSRGRHLYSAGRPSRWALVYILVVCFLMLLLVGE